jgi:ABC-type dipeptide/oligopeptide/nickel transport system ATPase subunit
MSVLLEGKKINKIFRPGDKETVALRDVSFVLNEGEVLGVVGESGSGKSTLLRVLSGLERPDSGELLHGGEPYRGLGPRQTGEFLQVIFQDAKSSFDPRMTMEKSIMESGRGKRDRKRLTELVGMVGLDEELLTRKPGQLSGGQCQRMSIARAFYSGAGILLCDEMTSALDVTSQAQVMEIMIRLKNAGMLSAIFVSHDIALVSTICDRVMVMKDGGCIEEGATLEVISSPKDEYTKGLIDSARKQSIE